MKQLVVCVLVAACGEVKGEVAVDASVDTSTEPPPDAPTGCSNNAAFIAQSLVAEVSSSAREERAILTDDELEIYVTRISGTTGIFRARRASTAAAWGPLVQVPTFPTADASAEALTPDGLTMYLGISGDLAVATRASTAAEFSTPSLLANVNSADLEFWVSIDPTNTVLHFSSGRDGTARLYRASRTEPSGAFGTPVVVDAPDAFGPLVTPDGLGLHYGVATANGVFPHFTTRASLSEPFPPGEAIAGPTFPQGAWATWVSPDRCRVYLVGPAPGGPGENDVNLISRD